MLNLVLSFILSFTAAIVFGKILIPILIDFKFGQTIREEGPKNHIKKSGTPTIGGLIFIISISLISLLFLSNDIRTQYPLLALVSFSLIGVIDDLLKIKKGKNLGLKANEKMILLVIVSLVLSFIGKKIFGTEINIPFIGTKMDLGYLYIPFMMFVYIGASNAVNLTDGLDGLATSVTVCALFSIGAIANSLGMTDETIFVSISIGALIGFLSFNINPAKVFMGDTGSLGLGGMLVALTIQISSPLLLILVGIIYIIETVSVIAQVISFKLTGRRIFKMSPIHHHFEICGLSENKIVMIFSLVTIGAGIIAYFST